MNSSFDTRLKRGLFPEMPQSFADGLLRAAETAGGTQNRSAQTDAAKSSATGSEPKKRRFPVGKVLAGAAAAVLAAASIVIAVFAPGIGRNKHGAVDPAAYNPLRGRWTLTEVEQNGETVDPETIGLQMQLQFSDESVTVSTQTGGAEGQYVYRYTLEDNAVTVTAEDAAVTVLPEGGGTYDPETDTLRFVGADGDGVLVFTREPDLVGKWTLTRIGELDPAALGVQYAEWMEFFADGTVTVIQLFNFDIEEETFAYTVYGKTVQIYTEGKTAPEHMLIPEQLVYDRETDTLRQKESNVYDPDSGRQDELIFSRTPNAIVWHSLVGKWTLTGIELYGSTGSPETSGLEMYLEFSDKESVTVTTVKETGTDTQTYRWHFISGNEIMLTEKEYITSSYYTILYDAATDTLRMDPDGYGLKGMMIFSRVLNKQTLLGVWKQTRMEHAVDPSPLDGFDYDYLKWEKEQTWEEDAKPQPWYLEFTADGRMYYFLYAPDGGVQGNQSAPYTISGNTLQWSGWTLRYEAETDTICWIHPTDRREYYERVPDAVIDDPYRQKISDLRKQYPEYFDLYATPRLKVIVWQMAEGSYSCALVPGSDLRKEAEIGIESRGTTIEEMRMILSTYYEARDCNIEPEQVEVVPFHNPISSYAYEIDETYTGRVRWLLTGIPFECDDPLYSAPLDSKVDIGGILNLEVSTVCDVDGDGRLETCMLTYGPTSGLFTFTLSVYRNGTAVYRNTFQTAYGYFRFQRMTDGLNLYYYDADSIKTTGRSTAAYAVTIEDGVIVLTDELRGKTVEYWGHDDPQWNMAVAKTPDAVIPEMERKEITELRAQFPEYFGLDTSKGLKVYVWQMAENDFSCALISGTDERSELEIGIQCKGTTIEQMRLILSTYGLEEKEIEVVPFHNSISSYWYEIDNDYKVWIRRLVKENMPFTNEELEGLKSPPFSIADVVYDVDGDGQLETCSLNRGPTSSDITVVFTVYRNGTLAYRNTFDMDEGEMTFYRSDNGLLIQHVIPWNDGIQLHTEYSISIENGMIVLTDEIRGGTVEYWGHDDPHWNMN